MPDVLTETAPGNGSEVPSVEVDALETSIGEVGDGSTPQQENLIPKARFDGLMGQFHKEQNARKRAEAELESLRAQQQQPEEKPPVTDTADQSTQLAALQEQVSQLTNLLQQGVTSTAREKVLAEYPEVAPFADLIVGESAEDFRQMAEILSERIKGLTPAQQEAVAEEAAAEAEQENETPAAGETPPNQAPVVTGGGQTFSGDGAAEERVNEAIKSGNFTDFLHAQWEKQVLESPDQGLVLEGS